MRFHAICGMPRSGSTLLANVIDQRPDTHVSATSCLPVVLASVSRVWTQSPELKSELILDREKTETRMRSAMRGLIEGWYEGHDDLVGTVFDKSRLWNHHLRLLQWLYPDARMVCVVRDLRAVLASVEKQHARTGIFDDSDTPQGKTLFARANALMDPAGIIGGCVNGIEDLLRRRPECVHFVKYEDFVVRPKSTMRGLYEDLDMSDHEHDFEHVENTTGRDVDGLYLHKFPHDARGPVEARDPDWERWVSPDLGQQLIKQFSGYNSAFNYGGGI